MDQKAIVKLCKELGCCDACALRYIGLKNPAAYENSSQFILKYQDHQPDSQTENTPDSVSTKTEDNNGLADVDSALEPDKNNGILEDSTPPSKRQKVDACVSCLGVLESWSWEQCCDMVKEQLDKKGYSCQTFACALSAPMATLLREKYVALTLADKCPEYDQKLLTPLKEAWKWSFGTHLSSQVRLALDSGAVCPLLVTVTMEYPEDLQELEVLKTLASSLFESRSKQKKRFTVELTRRSVEQALDQVSLSSLQAARGEVSRPPRDLRCSDVSTTHAPALLGGRYIKLSRTLPQTPWLVGGTKMMESSVQEVIYQPIARLYRMSPKESEKRLKFISAGREDVDVRCLGDGRPFAIEVTDPHRELTSDELQQVCDEISQSGTVRVKLLVSITKEDLTLLKKGEEFKTKTYEALCVKLTHCDDDEDKDSPPVVTPRDIARINTYRTTAPDCPARVVLKQRTPIRVLHRRPLIDRTRIIYQLSARSVPGHPSLFIISINTEAGTYIKEWAHGELRRSRPSLGTALGAATDILALDVASVHLDWPPSNKS